MANQLKRYWAVSGGINAKWHLVVKEVDEQRNNLLRKRCNQQFLRLIETGSVVEGIRPYEPTRLICGLCEKIARQEDATLAAVAELNARHDLSGEPAKQIAEALRIVKMNYLTFHNTDDFTGLWRVEELLTTALNKLRVVEPKQK